MKPTNLFKHLLPSLWERVREGLLLLCLMVMGATEVKAQEAYACYNAETLTFYYDNNRSSRTGTTYDATGSMASAWDLWGDYRTSITQVVFDSSFADARPTGTGRWFIGCSNLTSITDIQYLNTSQVTSMSFMFDECSRLTSLDVSNFNTANVTSMHMMFEGCSSLTSLDVSNFNTSNVIEMGYMFNGCSKLTSLDVSNFNTAKVTDMSQMFHGCSALTTIYCSDSWSPSSSSSMFYGCTKLVSQSSGLSYDSSKTDATYANPTTGYFTALNYATFTPTNNTLTFYKDNQMASRPGTSYYLNSGEDLPGWVNDEKNAVVQHVVFDPSFDTARPTYTNAWFAGMTNLQDITGMEYLHTDEVTYMRSMFQDASSLTSLDLTTFNTAKVTNMVNMFFGCTGLTSLYLTSFNTENVTSMASMFRKCSSLTSFDLSSFNTKKVEDMSSMFNTCSALTTIIAGDDWSTSAVVNSGAMFTSCPNLEGRNGTTFDSNHTDAEYARFDNAPSSPGYLSDINSASTQEVSLNLEIWGVGAMRLIDKDGNIVKSLSNDESSTVGTTVRWTKGTRMLMEVTAPAGYDLSHSTANLFIDGVPRTLVEDTDEDGNIYFSYYVSNVYEPHSYILIFTGLESTAASNIIEFVDANVKAICVANWDTDGDGELSKEEAAAVTTLLNDGNSVFKNNTTITSFEEFQYFTGITKVEDRAFQSCTKLKSIKLPEGITEIATLAFYGCSKLRSIDLPESLTTLGSQVFNSCTSLRQFYLPANVSSINSHPFPYCYNLVSIVVDENNTVFDSRDNCNGIVRTSSNTLVSACPVTVLPDDLQYLGPNAFQALNIKRLEIPASMKSLGYWALYLNADLEEMVMHPEVPFTFNPNFFREASYYPTNCKLIVPAGTRDAYIAAGWTEDVFKGGVVEAAGEDDGEITWCANMTGNTSSEEYVDIMVSGGDVEIELSSTTPNGKETFDVSVVGTHLQFCVYAKPDKVIQLFFNGDEYTDLLQDAGTENGLKLYKIEGDTLSQFFTSGTWVVEFEKKEITWNLIMVGDVDVANNEAPQDYVYWWFDNDVILSASEGSSLKATTTIDKTSYIPAETHAGFQVYVKPGQTFNVTFNGTDVSLTRDEDNDENGSLCYVYSANDYEQFATDGTWVVEFKKENITWKVVAAGDVPEGAMAEFIMDEDSDTPMVIEVGNASTQASGTYLNDQLPPDVQFRIYVPAGYQFKVWFNGEEYTNNYWLSETTNEGVQHWSYYTSEAEDLKPLFMDGTWVVAFTKINNFDVNCDGQVSIADVTKLVNKILGKE